MLLIVVLVDAGQQTAEWDYDVAWHGPPRAQVVLAYGSHLMLVQVCHYKRKRAHLIPELTRRHHATRRSEERTLPRISAQFSLAFTIQRSSSSSRRSSSDNIIEWWQRAWRTSANRAARQQHAERSRSRREPGLPAHAPPTLTPRAWPTGSRPRRRRWPRLWRTGKWVGGG